MCHWLVHMMHLFNTGFHCCNRKSVGEEYSTCNLSLCLGIKIGIKLTKTGICQAPSVSSNMDGSLTNLQRFIEPQTGVATHPTRWCNFHGLSTTTGKLKLIWTFESKGHSWEGLVKTASGVCAIIQEPLACLAPNEGKHHKPDKEKIRRQNLLVRAKWWVPSMRTFGLELLLLSESETNQ